MKLRWMCSYTMGEDRIIRRICGNMASREAESYLTSAWGADAKAKRVSGTVRRNSTDRRLCRLRKGGRAEAGACRMLGALEEEVLRCGQAQPPRRGRHAHGETERGAVRKGRPGARVEARSRRPPRGEPGEG